MRFLPSYLTRFAPSPDFDTTELISRIVQRIQILTEADQPTLREHRSPDGRLMHWTSPNCLIRSGVSLLPSPVFLHVRGGERIDWS